MTDTVRRGLVETAHPGCQWTDNWTEWPAKTCGRPARWTFSPWRGANLSYRACTRHKVQTIEEHPEAAALSEIVPDSWTPRGRVNPARMRRHAVRAAIWAGVHAARDFPQRYVMGIADSRQD